MEDEDSGEEFSFPLEEPITTVRSSKRLNNRRRQKKFEDAELTTESALLRKVRIEKALDLRVNAVCLQSPTRPRSIFTNGK